ncbi:MAG: helix-turn-helix transcriptional regulator [Deltaproteobacteria bacterium]|nr:helix-turn-helix transcriptional regulator [Deltaproteobacteria bacterium]
MRRRFDEENCSVARALEALGDWWTLLIIREAFLGARRFADFESALSISKNVLTKRLRHLVEHDVLTTVDAGRFGSRLEYQLTPRGKDLMVLVTALRQWGDRWVFGPGQEPVLVCERGSGRPVGRLRVQAEDGRSLAARDLELRPGPGADETTLRRFEALGRVDRRR